ncbi:hypothetical protein [Moheibacter lacus]|uniref:Uncharacterized protein n=1 Tax=Moheibacter lacus TaxID=2745851 RepID=A0A838ZR19_9FLAO|nr:hypothetical protein [Moheibacter lacus]MBA5629905.1 hypothetical protein [Moheibacter lacus]
MKILETLSQYIRVDDEILRFIDEFGQEKQLAKGEVLSSQNTVDRNLYYLKKDFYGPFILKMEKI